MEKKKVVPVWLRVILIALCAAGLVFIIRDHVRVLSYGFSLFSVCGIFAVLQVFLAIQYCIKGFGKRAHLLFKLFCLLATINQVIYLYTMASVGISSELSTVAFFAEIIHLGAWCTITFATDLGKKKSTIVCAILLAYALLSIILLWVQYGLSAAADGLALLLSNAIFGIMVYGKYQDKEARGTK